MHNALNWTSKLKTKTCVEINDARGRYNTNSQIMFKTSTLKWSLYNFIDACILVKGTITIPNTADGGAGAETANKNVIFKNCTLFE